MKRPDLMPCGRSWVAAGLLLASSLLFASPSDVGADSPAFQSADLGATFKKLGEQIKGIGDVFQSGKDNYEQGKELARILHE